MRESNLPGSMPKLAVLVIGSAFDAAIHDAFGKAHDLNCYETYSREFMGRDLSAYLGPDYAGQWLESYILPQLRPRLELYHTVGAADPLTTAEVTKPVGDGLPETLPDWIRYNGLTHFKIKLNGNDLPWDLERVLTVDRLAAATPRERGAGHGCYSLDFNERCESVGYLIELLRRLAERSPRGFERIQYVEQPTPRDLLADSGNRMHAAAKLKPVVIDESLTDLETLLRAREMGYTGAALKACKGQSQSLLMAAAAQRLGMFLCVQDLTCSGAALIQSAGLAARVPGVTAIEANARQFCPEANRPWESRFPGIFRVREGWMDTSDLCGAGLGAV
jgi:L-alanine-DL-glutamate epimerase-like enolase superfamily enzyme